jgi:hypothetical protein
MRNSSKLPLLALCAGALLPIVGQAAATHGTDSVPATWKVQEIRYSYVGFTTAYNCDAAEDKLKEILLALGAHPGTQVRATGCNMNRPSRNFFVTITSATPVPATDAIAVPAKGEKSRQELLERLGNKNPISSDQFPATWKSVDLSNDRKLNLRPGDCELMEGLRDNVLPKLSVKIESNRVQCTPRQLSISTPELKVSALVPLASPDQKQPTT